MTDTTSIEIRKWVHRGTMLVNAECLNHDDPDHPYNQAIAQGVRPEDYGLIHPLSERFAGLSRGQLIQKIIDAEKQIEDYIRYIA